MPLDPVQHAIQVAFEAHRDQFDKPGRPYVEHCRRVAALVLGADERIVALHDVVGQAPGWTLDRLLEEGFSSAIVDAVDALTRRMDEAEDDFMRRAIANRLARPVKQADLEDNLVQAEQAGLDTEKFLRGLEIILLTWRRSISSGMDDLRYS